MVGYQLIPERRYEQAEIRHYLSVIGRAVDVGPACVEVFCQPDSDVLAKVRPCLVRLDK